jgi:glycerophosphoryl diester phosphodiesterase
MVEFDVKLSADNVAFLMHDATLERTTTGRGRADALPWRELSRLDAGGWHSAQYAGEALPTFTAIARWARAHGVACNAEIKPTPGRERETGAAVALDAQALWRDAEVPPLLSSFSEDALIAARDAVPELPRALLLDELPADWLARLQRLECVALDANHKVLTEAVVRAAHAGGYRVLAYTVNDAARVQELGAWGVDGIITDAVDRIAADVLPPAPPLSRA